jgi:ketosteroid isomerase-like protein
MPAPCQPPRLSILALSSLGLLACTAPASTTEAERFIIESERQWAASVATGDTSAVVCILADDFLGVDPDGTLYTKAAMVADTRDAPKYFLSNHLNEVKFRFFGTTAVAQGNESWERRTGTPRFGRFVWTDTWVQRNGRWQIVAAEDLVVADSGSS